MSQKMNEDIKETIEAERELVEDWIESLAIHFVKSRNLLSEREQKRLDERIRHLCAFEIGASSRPEWTRKKPVEPGTYWIYSKRIGFSQLCFAMKSKNGLGIFITTAGGGLIKTPEYGDELYEGQWVCGPIYDPKNNPPKDA